MLKLYLMIRELHRREEGASLAEYGLLVALIGVACITAVTLLGESIAATFDVIANAI